MAISRERGIVLVIVLWIIALLSMMAASFAYFIRIETTVATRGSEQAQGRALAEAGVHYALMQLLSPTAAEEWPVDGSEREVEWGQGKVLVKVAKASGMIDLNKAKRELLEGLLAAGGVESDALDSLLDAIEDWRDPNDETQLNGAEREDYLAAGYSLGPKNAPFESVEELLQVMGMTPAIYERIASRLTVFSQQTGIDPALATADVLGAPGDCGPRPLSIDSATWDAGTEHMSVGGQSESYRRIVVRDADSGAELAITRSDASGMWAVDIGDLSPVSCEVTAETDIGFPVSASVGGAPAGCGSPLQGAKLYAEMMCNICHGDDGSGATADDIQGEPTREIRRAIRKETVHDGIDVTRAEARAISVFLRNPGPLPVLPQKAFSSPTKCRTCHPRQYKEWSGDMMAYSAVSPTFNALESLAN